MSLIHAQDWSANTGSSILTAASASWSLAFEFHAIMRMNGGTQRPASVSASFSRATAQPALHWTKSAASAKLMLNVSCHANKDTKLTPRLALMSKSAPLRRVLVRLNAILSLVCGTPTSANADVSQTLTAHQVTHNTTMVAANACWNVHLTQLNALHKDLPTAESDAPATAPTSDSPIQTTTAAE